MPFKPIQVEIDEREYHVLRIMGVSAHSVAHATNPGEEPGDEAYRERTAATLQKLAAKIEAAKALTTT